jgi:lipoyl(octanoyl) transferase
MISPSSSVIATNVGHIHAPRSRQRTRAGQKRSSRSTAPESSLRPVAELWVAQLGTVPYEDGVRLQETLRERRQTGELPDLLLVLEHPPVYTKGKRTEPADLPMGEDWYRAQGIEVCDTDRGGRVTYHGPGQLVAYPIMAVERVADFVRTMEGAIVSALADEGIAAEVRGTPFTGVWAGDAKIASIGVRLSGGVTTHGLAVNVDNDLQPFEWIVPCGIDHVRMTSVARETRRGRSLPCFRKRMAWRFAEAFGMRQRLVSAGRLLEREVVAA